MQHRQRRRSSDLTDGGSDSGQAAVETGLRVAISGAAALTVLAVFDAILGGWRVDFETATACVMAGGDFAGCVPDRLAELFAGWVGNYDIDLEQR